jgi:hypothetical protein
MFLKPISYKLALRRIRRARRSPIVIGATGGSGTRVIHGVLEKAGLFMGAEEKLNHAGDAMDIEPMLDRFINPILAATKSLDYKIDDLPKTLARDAQGDLAHGIDNFLLGLPGTEMPWGWKNPRSMYVLPFIAELFPDFRFIHLVRDGRDMATSENQNQPRKHYQALFGEALVETDPGGSIQLWAKANLSIANWGETHLRSRYLRIRFEDLCEKPDEEVSRILSFAGFENFKNDAVHDIANEFVAPPGSLGRWRDLDAKIADALTHRGSDALSYFGYADPTPAPPADSSLSKP